MLFVSMPLLAAVGCDDDADLGTGAVRADSDAKVDGADRMVDTPPEISMPVSDGGEVQPAEPTPPEGPPDAGAETAGEHPPDPRPDGAAGEVSGDRPDGEAPMCPGADCPLAIAPGHLQVWLRGDEGVDCVFDGITSRVREWRDQTGNGNHAHPSAGKVGPLCGAKAGTLNGKPALTFPRTAGLEDGEHLELSLAPIQDKPFTVVVVEKRTNAMDFGSWMIGAPLLDTSVSCLGAPVNENRARVLQIGYPAPFEKQARTWGPSCGAKLNDLLQPGAGIPDPNAPTTTTLWTVILTADRKLILALNGQKKAEAAEEGLMATSQPIIGFIGRGFQRMQADGRFRGDIAEILIFDVALDDQQQRTLEQHLRPRWKIEAAN